MLTNLEGFLKGYKIVFVETDSLGLIQNSVGKKKISKHSYFNFTFFFFF